MTFCFKLKLSINLWRCIIFARLFIDNKWNLYNMKNPWIFIKKSDIFSHFISIKYLPRWLVLLVDVLLCTFSFVFSYFIVSHLSVSNDEILNLALPSRLFILLFFQIIFFWFFHTYSGILRYSGYVDAANTSFCRIFKCHFTDDNNLPG